MNAFYENMLQPTKAFYGKNMTFREHLHKQVELIYVFDGEIDVRIGDEKKTISSGELGIAFPNMIHSYTTKEYCSHITLIFDLDMAGDYTAFLTKYRCLTSFLEKKYVHPDVNVCLRALARNDIMENQSLLKGYITVLLGNLLKELHLEKREKKEEPNLVDAILNYATQNYREPISLDTMSSELGVAKYTISRIFRNEIQSSFIEYLNSLRIGFAQHLLGNFRIPVTTIALESGFSSQRTFNRVFKEFHGISPREYRKRIGAA